MDKGFWNLNPQTHSDTRHVVGHNLSSQASLISDPQHTASTSSPLTEPFPLFSPDASSVSYQSSQTSLGSRTATSVDSTSPEHLPPFQSPVGSRISLDLVDSLVTRAIAADEPSTVNVSTFFLFMLTVDPHEPLPRCSPAFAQRNIALLS